MHAIRNVFVAAGVVAILALSGPWANASLINRYSFNDGTANDSVGGLNGTGDATISGGAAHFDGLTSINMSGIGTETAALSSVSFETWVTLPAGASGSIFVVHNGTPFIYLGPDNAQAGTTALGGSYIPGFDLRTGTEKCVMVTISEAAGVDTQTVYVDGKFIGDHTYTTSHLADFYGGNLYLGTALGNLSAGSINEFRVYNTVLTQGEVTADFAAGPNHLAPEPGTIVLLATSLIGLLAYAWRKRR